MVASCLQNRLVGVEYKKSIQRGQKYRDRAKMLERAVSSPQGAGYGIGISLEHSHEPTDVSWIYNRWPRYTYQSDHLDIRLQYYIDSHSIVQQYQIRNNGQKEASLPYIINSDICFREHESSIRATDPIPTIRSPKRLILFLNSEVVIRSGAERASLKMAVFLNAQRVTAWTENLRSSDGEATPEINDPRNISEQKSEKLEEAEDKLRRTILDKKLPSYGDDQIYKYTYSKHYDAEHRRKQSLPDDEHNFAEWRSELRIPENTTQELCAIIQLSELLPHEIDFIDASSSGRVVQDIPTTLGAEETEIDNIWNRQLALVNDLKGVPLNTTDSEHRSRIVDFLAKHIAIGEELAKQDWLGEARYHFHTAYLIAESFFKEDILFPETHFRYAMFLDDNGWYTDGFELLNDLVDNLSSRECRDADITNIWTEALDRLASMYLTKNDFSSAEKLYRQAFSRLPHSDTELDAKSAHFSGKIAYTLVRQGRDDEADKEYEQLLNGSKLQRRTLLSNRAFVKRRLGQFEEAETLYKNAIRELDSEFPGDAHGSPEPRTEPSVLSDGSQERWNRFAYKRNLLYLLSGIFVCLGKLTESPNSAKESRYISSNFTAYIDVNALLASSTHLKHLLLEDPLHFPIVRQLESCLSVCSIPVKGDNETNPCVAFVDADPLNCIYEGRVA